MSDALIPPEPRTVPFAGSEVTVRVLTMGQVLRLVELFKGGKLEKLKADADLFDWIETFPEEMIGITMIAMEMKRDQVNAGSVEEFVHLLGEILDLNRDFFFRKIGPALRILIGKLALVAGLLDGPMPSRASSVTATASPASSATPLDSSPAS